MEQAERLFLRLAVELEFVAIAAEAVAGADAEKEIVIGVVGAIEPGGEGPTAVGEVGVCLIELAGDFGGADVAAGEAERLGAVVGECGGDGRIAQGGAGAEGGNGGRAGVAGGVLAEVGLFEIIVKDEAGIDADIGGGEFEPGAAGERGGGGEAGGVADGQEFDAAVAGGADLVAEFVGWGFGVGDSCC